MKARLLRVARLLAYPAFYLFCLGLFGYLTFPFGRLKDRIIAEFDKSAKPGQRLEIGKLSSYWLTGVEVSGLKLHMPPEEAPAAGFPGAADFGAAAGAPAKESVIVVDEAHARVRILPLLIGRVRVDFWASVFGGEIKGTVPVGNAKGEVEVTIDHVDVSKIEPLGQAVPVPLRGIANGKLQLEAPDGKFNKANGNFDLTVSDVTVSDGKTKIMGLLELPTAKLGDVVVSAEAKDGTLKVTKLSAAGTDLEIIGDGKVNLREPWSEAVSDLYLRFKFTDGYRGKNGTTKSLLGEPGSAVPGLMEMQVPKMKRAKRPDGFYGWHISGPLKKLRFDPSTSDAGGPASTVPLPAKRPFGKGVDAPRRPVHTPGADAAKDPADLNVAPQHAVPAPEPPPPQPAAAAPSAPPQVPLRAPALPAIAPAIQQGDAPAAPEQPPAP